MNTSTPHPLPGHGRAQIAIYFFCALIFFYAVDLVLNFLLVVVLPDSEVEGMFASDPEGWFVIVVGLNALVMLPVLVGTIVFFLIWLHTAVENLQRLGTRKPEYSPGWAVGGFFIPIANLFIPYKAVKETWVLSDPRLETPGEEMWQQRGASSIVGWWWAFWILSTVVERISSRISNDVDSLNGVYTAAKVEIVTDALVIIAAVLAIMVISGLDRRQQFKSQSQLEINTPPPPPMFV